jgi:dTDP-glucose 4,6-dehydratase
MKILITGSKGVVGSQLTTILNERGHDVFGIDLMHAPQNNYERCDVSEFRQLERIFINHGPFDFVYHTAAEFGRWNGEDYYEQLWMTNAIGTKNIIRLQEMFKFKLVHFSSSEVYGDFRGFMAEDVMDTIAIKQMNDYAMTKWVNEMQIRNSRIQFGTNSVIVRLFNTYGPGEWYHPYRSVNARFCYAALHGLPITVYKGHMRTSTYLEDTCQTLSNIIDNFQDGKVYNIGGFEYHSIEDLADIIWQETGADKSLITYKEAEPMTTKVKMVDTTKAVMDLKHMPNTSLREGVKKTLEWMKKYYAL